MPRSMDADPLDLALVAAVGARLCHDLTGPVSAVVNGVEIAGDGGADAAEALALVARSAETAAARLRFLRIAFGPVLGPSALSAIEFGGIAAAYFAPTRATLHWPARPVDPPGGTKLAALVLLLAEEAVPLGGTVRVACEAGRLEVRTVPVRGGGLRPEVEAALDGRWADGSARAAPGYLAYRVARANGIDLRHADTSDGLVITARTGHVP